MNIPNLLIILLAISVPKVYTISPEEMDEQIGAFINNRSIMGVALQITKADKTVYRTNQGFRDWERKLPIDNNTVFRMASLSKGISSCGLLLLLEQNKLKLTDPIGAILGY